MLSTRRCYLTLFSTLSHAKLRKTAQTKAGNTQKVVAEGAFFYLGKKKERKVWLFLRLFVHLQTENKKIWQNRKQ